jgi:hypothetical protein
MPLLKWLKKETEKGSDPKNPTEDVDDDEERRRVQEEGRDAARRNNEEEAKRTDGTKFVYFACERPKEDVINILQSVSKDVQVS